MGFYTPEELEYILFQEMVNCNQNNKRLLLCNFQPKVMSEFNNQPDAINNFLEQLAEKGYIAFEGPGMPAIVPGEKAMEWRIRMAQLFPEEKQVIGNQTFNIAHAHQVQAAGRDITNTITETDAEKLVEILKKSIPTDQPSDSLAAKIRKVLDCGKSALDILKGIISLT